jgi:hypothetical protein
VERPEQGPPDDHRHRRTDSSKKPTDSQPGWTPLDIFKLGLKHEPYATKFVLGALVVFAGATLVLSWGRGLSSLAPVVVFIIVVGLFIALLTSALKRARIAWLGDVLAIAFVAIVIGVIGLFVSSAFFGVPSAGANLLAVMTGVPGPASTGPSHARSLPDSTFEGDWVFDAKDLSFDEADFKATFTYHGNMKLNVKDGMLHFSGTVETHRILDGVMTGTAELSGYGPISLNQVAATYDYTNPHVTGFGTIFMNFEPAGSKATLYLVFRITTGDGKIGHGIGTLNRQAS